jgi:hypothetical protein
MMNFLKYVGLKKGVKKSTDEQMGAYIEPSSGLFSVIQQAKLRSDPEIFPYNMNRIIPQRINLAQIDVDVLKSQKSLFDDVVKESEKILSGDVGVIEDLRRHTSIENNWKFQNFLYNLHVEYPNLVTNSAFKDLYFSVEIYGEYLWKGEQTGFDNDTNVNIIKEARNIRNNIDVLINSKSKLGGII